MLAPPPRFAPAPALNAVLPPASLRLRSVTTLHTHRMDHNPSGGAGRSGRPGAAGPDQWPDQEALFAPEEVLPRGTSAGVAAGPAVPGPAPALDLDAVSDYVPALDDGLALEYGPVPDNEAARDYAKALDYGAPPGRTPEPPAPALRLAPHPAPVARLAPGQAQDPVPGPDAAVTSDPAPAAPAAPAHVPAIAAHVPPGADPWALGQVAGQVSPPPTGGAGSLPWLPASSC
jgi:hypothetical protein